MAVPKIKICGITAAREVQWLNENKVDYAGFVFFEKSKRCPPYRSVPAPALSMQHLLHGNIPP